MIVNVPVLHYGSKQGYASHFEAVSCGFLVLEYNGDVHTPLFEACLPYLSCSIEVGQVQMRRYGQY